LLAKVHANADHDDRTRVMRRLAEALADDGQYAAAREVALIDLAMRKKLHGEGSAEAAYTVGTLAWFAAGLGDIEEALRLEGRALAVLRRERGDHADTANTLVSHAWHLITAKRLAEAHRIAKEAAQRAQRSGSKAALARALDTLCYLGKARGDLAIAEKFARKRIDVASEAHGDDHPLTAQARRSLANLLYRLVRNHREVVTLYEKARPVLVDRLQSAQPAAAVDLLSRLALAYQAAGRREDALAACEESIRFERAAHGETVILARQLGWKATVLQRSAPVDAIRTADESLRIYAQRGVDVDWGMAHPLGARMVCLMSLGRGDEARKALDRYVHVSGLAANASDKVTVLANCSYTLQQLGDWEEAMKLARRAYSAAARLQPPNPYARASTALRLGNILSARGRRDEGELFQRETVDRLRALFPRGHPNTVAALRYLAQTLRFLGRSDAALRLLKESIAMARRLRPGDSGDVASGLSRSSACLLSLRRHEEGLEKALQALAMARRIYGDKDFSGKVECREYAANHLSALGRFDEALKLARGTFEMAVRLNGSASASDVCDFASHLALAGHVDEALPKFRESVELGRRTGASQHHVHLANLGYLLLERRKQASEAAALFEEAIACVEERRWRARALDAEARARYFSRLKQVGMYPLMVRAQLEMGKPRDALRYLERGRARSVLDLLDRGRVDLQAEAERRARQAGDEAVLEKLVSARNGLAAAEREMGLAEFELGWVRQRARGDRVRGEKAKARQQAARSAFQVARRKRSLLVREMVDEGRPIEPMAVQRMLGKDERLLIYQLFQNRGVLFVVPPLGEPIEAHTLTDDAGAVVSRLAEFVKVHRRSMAGLAAGTRGMKPAKAETAPKASVAPDLFRALVPPAVWNQIRGAKRVYVAPDGPLYRLPFETLVIDAKTGATWLDEGPAVSYIPSGSVLRWCQRRRDDQRARRAPVPVVAVGGAKYRELSELPGTAREAESIAKSMGEKAVALIGAKATEAELFARAPQAGILHIATHLMADETDGGSFSRLMLTPPDEKSDGALHLYELLERWRDRIPACQLVVLSACQTRSGPVQRGDAPYAMPIGFMYAGAPSVIASLWRVDDESTAELFADFYARLAKGTPKLQAFTEARKALKKKYPNPYHWAAFVYIGDPR